MYDMDEGLGRAMAESAIREKAEKAGKNTSIIAAAVLKALVGMPVTPQELSELRRIAGENSP